MKKVLALLVTTVTFATLAGCGNEPVQPEVDNQPVVEEPTTIIEEPIAADDEIILNDAEILDDVEIVNDADIVENNVVAGADEVEVALPSDLETQQEINTVEVL
jgi:uncharacterized protein YcfL